jgi:hypothetical protein
MEPKNKREKFSVMINSRSNRREEGILFLITMKDTALGFERRRRGMFSFSWPINGIWQWINVNGLAVCSFPMNGPLG